MPRSLSLLLIFLALAVAACGAEAEPQAVNASATPPAEGITAAEDASPTATKAPTPKPMPTAMAAPTETTAPAGTGAAEVVWEVHALSEVRAKQDERDTTFYRFLNKASLTEGLYALEAGERDSQGPHSSDEVYVVLRGSATLQVGEETAPAGRGSLFYVRAQVSHRFVDISDVLQVLVFFSQSTPEESARPWRAFSIDELETEEAPFLEAPTLQGALLQVASGETSSLTASEDGAVYLVWSGSGRAQPGADEVALEEGTILYVEGQGKVPVTAEEALIILILQPRPTVDDS